MLPPASISLSTVATRRLGVLPQPDSLLAASNFIVFMPDFCTV
ncbi:hypothetical protein C404_05265 [Ralstonia sp. AU12-08]|nr:hypothetical protein C404_05265 [Ralstonia sp. AU12-08]